MSTRRRVAVGHLLAEELRELEADGMIDRERSGKPSAPVMCSLTGIWILDGRKRGAPMIQFVRAGSIVLAACALAVFRPSAAHSQRSEYDRESAGTRMLELASGTSIRMLLDASNLGSGEVEVAEITFPAGMSPTGAHRHAAIEIFYVIEGVLGHVVNGEEHRIEPGSVGVVKPGDEVVHRVVGSGPVRALVIWVPGGEGDRIAPPERWRRIGG